MSIRTCILLSAVTALIALAAFAGAATASDGPSPPGGQAPGLPSAAASGTLTLPRNVHPGTAASIVLRLQDSAAAELRSDRIACAFRLGERSLAGTARISGTRAICVVRVPRNAAGRTLRGAIRVLLDHVSVERQFSFKVARR